MGTFFSKDNTWIYHTPLVGSMFTRRLIILIGFGMIDLKNGFGLMKLFTLRSIQALHLDGFIYLQMRKTFESLITNYKLGIL